MGKYDLLARDYLQHRCDLSHLLPIEHDAHQHNHSTDQNTKINFSYYFDKF